MKTCRKQLHTYSASLSQCPECRVANKKIWQQANKDYIYETYKANRNKASRRWYADNRGKAAAKTALYKARKLKATPKWADLAAIKEFYINCPAGYHVDHIVPLKAVNVSGLHILANLQYLTVTENCSKRNKYESN